MKIQVLLNINFCVQQYSYSIPIGYINSKNMHNKKTDCYKSIQFCTNILNISSGFCIAYQ